MPLPTVVALDMPADLRPDLRQVLRESCERAIGEGQCPQYTSLLEQEARATWIAKVHAATEDALVIEVQLRWGSKGTILPSRRLRFSPSDPPEQRWATAGIVTAALAIEATSREAMTAAAAPPATPSKKPNARRTNQSQALPAAPSVTSDGPQLPRAFVELHGLVGPGMDRGRGRLGGVLGLSVGPGGYPEFLWASMSVARSSGQVELSWTSAGLGLGFSTARPNSRLALDLRLGGLISWVTLEAHNGGDSSLARRTRLGMTGQLLGVWLPSRRLMVSLGGAADTTWPRIEVRTFDRLEGQEPVLGYRALLGLHWMVAP